MKSFFKKKIKCGTCGKKVVDYDLATAQIKCLDGVINIKLCNTCEKKFEKRAYVDE